MLAGHHIRPLDEIFSAHEAPEQSCESENVTRISIHKVVSYKWVKYYLRVNNPFKFSLHTLYKLLWNATLCKLASNLSVVGAIWEAKIKSAVTCRNFVWGCCFGNSFYCSSNITSVKKDCILLPKTGFPLFLPLFNTDLSFFAVISRPVMTPLCHRWVGQSFLLNHGSKKQAAAIVFFSL